MIQKIKSRKVDLPPIFLIENEEDFKELPKGIPYIIGKQSDLSFITIFLEFQTLYKSCMSMGIPVKWLDCLKRVGYNVKSIKKYTLHSGGTYGSAEGYENVLTIDDFIQDQYFVNFDKLSELYILPKWLEDLKSSVQTNIIDEVTFDPTAFNKKLGLNVGYGCLKTNSKNLLILDVSGSIPKSISMSISALAKLMSKKFYADIIFTASQTIFIDYDDIEKTDIISISNNIGRNNESVMFSEIVKEHKHYNTVICFGDNDNPGSYGASAEFPCNFTCETLYSLHTQCKNPDNYNVAGYSRCLKPNETFKVKDWVTTIE